MDPGEAVFLGAGPPGIEDHALIGDGMTAALVSRAGCVDWLCWPRFDSPACFAALLGSAEHGAWRIAPEGTVTGVRRRYRGGSLVLETVFDTPEGAVSLTDALVSGPAGSALVRVAEGRDGRVALRMAMALRPGYGAEAPVASLRADGAVQVDALALRADVALTVAPGCVAARFTLLAEQSVAFVLAASDAAPLDPGAALAATQNDWAAWAARSGYRGPYQEAVARSLLTLQALIYRPTGAMVAAPTTSLPEQPGGARNWDYRYCWLRDSALAMRALLRAGHRDEAAAWRDWLVRAVAGDPARMQILYGIAGERDLTEREADWLPGYQGARPVRIGNAAHGQLQLDVYGEVMDALSAASAAGLGTPPEVWAVQRSLIEHLATIWQCPDEGIWEVRGGRRRFTFSAVMAWAAVDRAIGTAEAGGWPAPLDRWRALRGEMHATVCRQGFDAGRNSFVQSFGGTELDASLLQLPLLGFLPPDDPRVIGTVAAIERELLSDGLLRRYRSESGGDGLPPGEGVFLACSFWLVQVYVMQGRREEARRLFERLLALRNDVGLLAEEYDPATRRMLGNFPQGFSHLALIEAALALD